MLGARICSLIDGCGTLLSPRERCFDFDPEAASAESWPAHFNRVLACEEFSAVGITDRLNRRTTFKETWLVKPSSIYCGGLGWCAVEVHSQGDRIG
jgi:hypothetical protein